MGILEWLFLAFPTSIPDTVNSFRHGMLKVLIPVLFINNL